MSAKTKNVLIATVGIDTGKNTLHLIGFDLRGEVVLRQKMSRRLIVLFVPRALGF